MHYRRLFFVLFFWTLDREGLIRMKNRVKDFAELYTTNGLCHTFTNFEHIVIFFCAKEMLELMHPLVSSLQGELMEVYLCFKKIDQVTESYQLIRDDIDSWFNRMYAKVLRLAENIGSQEQRPRICRMQRNRENHPADSVARYWKITTVIPFWI